LYITSPLKKQHFRLKDGVCLENADFSIAAYAVRVNNGRIELKEPV
jgi:nitrite reductase (NADH) small subunit